MLPAFWSGDTVSVHRASVAGVELGDVVVFARDRCFVAHRVVRRIANGNDIRLVTRGDAQPDDDPPIGPEDFLGVVKTVPRAGTHRPLHRARPLAARAIGWVVQRSSRVRRLLDRLNAVRLPAPRLDDSRVEELLDVGKDVALERHRVDFILGSERADELAHRLADREEVEHADADLVQHEHFADGLPHDDAFTADVAVTRIGARAENGGGVGHGRSSSNLRSNVPGLESFPGAFVRREC
jgi:hypothetical protein